MEIIYDGPVPPHRQIAAWLRQRIDAGEFEPGRALPSRKTIAQETGTALTTVDRALGVLRDEGLIYTIAQRGSFVRDDGSQG